MIHTYSPTKNTFTVYACNSPSVPFPTSARSRTLRRTDKSHSHPDQSPAIRLQSAARTRHSAHCSPLPMEPPLVHPVSEERGWSIRERISQYESEITDIFQRCCNPAFPHPVSSIHPLPTSLLLLLFSQWTHPSSTSAGGPTPPPLRPLDPPLLLLLLFGQWTHPSSSSSSSSLASGPTPPPPPL